MRGTQILAWSVGLVLLAAPSLARETGPNELLLEQELKPTKLLVSRKLDREDSSGPGTRAFLDFHSSWRVQRDQECGRLGEASPGESACIDEWSKWQVKVLKKLKSRLIRDENLDESEAAEGPAGRQMEDQLNEIIDVANRKHREKFGGEVGRMTPANEMLLHFHIAWLLVRQEECGKLGARAENSACREAWAKWQLRVLDRLAQVI